MDIRGFTVHDLWIEQASEIAAEYYASIILDRSEKKLLAMLSRMGGMDVEEIAETDPDALVKRHVEPGEGLTAELAQRARGRRRASTRTSPTRSPRCWSSSPTSSTAEDATLIEVNPLIVTTDREVVALDSKVTIDGNALFRHPELAELADKSAEDPQEAMAKEKGLTYVKLGGNIGILGNGAGLCMSTLDVVAQAGGKPANFLDAGGGSKAEAIVDALEVITSDENVDRRSSSTSSAGSPAATRSPRGSSRPRGRSSIDVPLVVRLDGTNSEEGLALLAEADLAEPARGEDDARRRRRPWSSSAERDERSSSTTRRSSSSPA